MKKYISINIFENEKYRISKVKDIYNDKFEIIEENDILKVRRIDKNEGWGAELKFKIFDKVKNIEYIKDIGNSDKNNIEIELDKNRSKNHYENNYFLLYVISNYNDLFKINYNELEKIIYIKRIDSDLGWEQDLIIEYYEKISKNIKHIKIGSSDRNEIKKKIDLKDIKYLQIPNYYNDNNYFIEKIKNEYDDEFYIDLDTETKILKIKRKDTDEGWGQNLMINILYKKKKYDIYIGPSKKNIFFKKLDLNDYKIYIGLTTIPSRANNDILINNLNKFIKSQNYEFDKIFITIPKKYKRFENNINSNIIEKIKKLKKVEIIFIDKDYGPASKYLGPYINNLIGNNDLLIIIDDDRVYNKNLVKNLVIAYRSFNQYEIFTGLWSYFFDKKYKYLNKDFLEITVYKEKNDDNFRFGNGVGGFFGFALNIKNKKEFINYNLEIQNKIEKSFFHDEGIILGYLKKKEKSIIYLKHYGCVEYDKESIDALCKSGLCNRSIIEKEILYITNYQSIL